MTGSDARGRTQLLLDAVRAAAAEGTRSEPSISDERLLAAIRGERPLSLDKRRRIILSVDLQERIAVLRHAERIRAEDAAAEQRLETEGHWDAQGWGATGMTLLAAADNERDIRPVRMETPFCTIDLIPIDADGRVWRINIRIAGEVADEVLRYTPEGVKLVDSDGEVWVSGRPNDAGELVGFWERDDDLWDRLGRVSLALKPL